LGTLPSVVSELHCLGYNYNYIQMLDIYQHQTLMTQDITTHPEDFSFFFFFSVACTVPDVEVFWEESVTVASSTDLLLSFTFFLVSVLHRSV